MYIDYEYEQFILIIYLDIMQSTLLQIEIEWVFIILFKLLYDNKYLRIGSKELKLITFSAILTIKKYNGKIMSMVSIDNRHVAVLMLATPVMEGILNSFTFVQFYVFFCDMIEAKLLSKVEIYVLSCKQQQF